MLAAAGRLSIGCRLPICPTCNTDRALEYLGDGRGWYRGLQAELFGFERHGDRARAGHVDFAVAAHDFDEFIELFGIAGGFDGEALGRRIDDSRMEDLRFLQYRGAAVLRA